MYSIKYHNTYIQYTSLFSDTDLLTINENNKCMYNTVSVNRMTSLSETKVVKGGRNYFFKLKQISFKRSNS